jgi:hypothetical protein
MEFGRIELDVQPDILRKSLLIVANQPTLHVANPNINGELRDVMEPLELLNLFVVRRFRFGWPSEALSNNVEIFGGFNTFHVDFAGNERLGCVTFPPQERGGKLM